METTITPIRTYDKNCIGCVKHNRDIMIAYITDDSENIIDLFLTQMQAKVLANDLAIMIKCNEIKIMKKKYIIEGNHPTLKYVNLEINRLDELSSKIGKLLAADYEITIKPQLKQIDKTESMGDVLRSALEE